MVKNKPFSFSFNFGKKADERSVNLYSEFAQYISDKWGGILSDTATPSTVMKVPAVWACVDAITGSIGSMPINLKERYKKGGREMVKNADTHPVQDLIKYQPNNEQTPIVVMRSWIANALIYGNGYCQIAKNSYGKRFLYVIDDSSRVSIEKNQNGDIRYVVKAATTGEKDITLMPSEMLHLRWLGFGSVEALNAFTYLKDTLTLALASIGFGIANIRDGNHSKLLLIHKLPPSDKKQREDIRSDLQKLYTGSKTSKNGAMYLPLDVSAQQIKDTLLDSQYTQLDTMLDEKVARFFGVQQHVIGLLSRSTNNNIESQNISYLQKTLLPWIVSIEQELATKLLTEAERKKYFIKFSQDGLLRGDSVTRYQSYHLGIQNGILSANEVRELEDRNPRDCGDDFLTPLNMTTTGEKNQNLDNGE